MSTKNIETQFQSPTLHLDTQSMETSPFAEVSRRLDFPMAMFIEKRAYETLIELPGEGNPSAAALALRWNNVLTEIASTRINGNYLFPATVTVRITGLDGVVCDKAVDVYMIQDANGNPEMVITLEKGRFDFLNGAVQ